jgi:hypothetical protein
LGFGGRIALLLLPWMISSSSVAISTSIAYSAEWSGACPFFNM